MEFLSLKILTSLAKSRWQIEPVKSVHPPINHRFYHLHLHLERDWTSAFIKLAVEDDAMRKHSIT